MKKLLPLLLLSLFSIVKTSAQSVVFAQLTGSPVDTTGWHLTGNAYVGNSPVGTGNSEVILADVGAYQSGAIFYTQPINIIQCDKWKAEFEFRIFDGTGADGLAFCLLDVPPTGFVSGGGVGIPSTSNGLKIVFDTYNNCGAQNPALQIRWGAGYGGGECDYTQPTLDNTSGQLSFFRSNDYNAVRIEYNAGNIDVYVNNTLYLSGYYVINFNAAYAGFTSSTGSLNDRHSIRNVYLSADMAVANAGADLATCPGGTVQLGTANDTLYHYQWSPATGLSNDTISNPTATLPNAGTYTYVVAVNLIGAPCLRYDTVTVTVNPFPTGTIVTDQAFCEGLPGQISYSGSASPSANYNWSFPGGNVQSGVGQGPYNVSWALEGTYPISVQVTENNCPSAIISTNITVESQPIAYFTYQQSDNYDVTFNDVSENSTDVEWIFGSLGSSTQSPANFNFPSPGAYPLTVIAKNDCGTDTLETTIYVLELVGLAENSALKGIAIFPTPATDNFNIMLSGYNQTFSYRITDVSGKVVGAQNSVQGPQAMVDATGLSAGMYFVTVNTAYGSLTGKLVKQ